MSNSQKLAALSMPKDVKDITNGILDSFTDKEKDDYTKKTTFSPSRLAWSSGGCARRWAFLFRGVNEIETISAFAQSNMQNGTDSHERMQGFIGKGPLDVDIEEQLQNVDPPINSYCDVIVNYEGKRIPVEIKTSNDVAFEYRKMSKKAADYHILQLLIYMKILKAKLGFLMYENKNTYEKLMIPVRMDAENTEVVESAWEWMQKVRKAFDDDEMPMYFKNRRKNSKICNGCPVRKTCDEYGEGTVDIPLLSKYERDKV